MKSIAIPIRIGKGGLARNEGPKAIDQALSLLTTTPCLNSVAAPQYGFVLNNLRFEIVNEKEGVVSNSSGQEWMLMTGLYEKKVSGSSNNLNTFAYELKQSIETYEKRLRDVSVAMTYIREERKIFLTVKGVLEENDKPYLYESVINVWK